MSVPHAPSWKSFNDVRTMNPETADLFRRYVVPNYTRFPVALVRGEGSYVWDDQGRRYLDFFPGWGCNLLGHCPPRVVEAIQRQAAELIHVPNTWHTEVQGRWAQLLSERSFGGKAFFCNSGAEANEAAIKLARMHASGKGDSPLKDRGTVPFSASVHRGGQSAFVPQTPQKGTVPYKIITFHGGFHGRTYGATSATAQPKYHEGIGPLLPGFLYAPYGDLAAVAKLIDDETCAILIEPIQGEGGIRIPPDGFLSGLRRLADENELLLIFDEVQTGCGRTGKWFAYEHSGIAPDIMTLAKSLCGGVAGAAMLTTAEIAASLRPGMHAATFGGNPIAAAAGIATIETIEQDGLLQRAAELGRRFRERLRPLADELPIARELRVCGLMIGLELSIDGVPIVERCLERGLLVNCTQQTVIRLLPAMTLSDEQLVEGCDILSEVLRSVCG